MSQGSLGQGEPVTQSILSHMAAKEAIQALAGFWANNEIFYLFV